MKNAITLEHIQSKIKSESYIVLPDGRSTLCMLVMENGFTIKGLSACVDQANFDMNMGRKIALEDAIRQIWPLEGYLLAQRIHDSQQSLEKSLSQFTTKKKKIDGRSKPKTEEQKRKQAEYMKAYHAMRRAKLKAEKSAQQASLEETHV